MLQWKLQINILSAGILGVIAWWLTESGGIWYAIIGLLYSYTAEHLYHKYLLHGGECSLKIKHRMHHKIFSGAHVRTQSRDSSMISEDVWVFPVVFTLHLVWMPPTEFLIMLVVFYIQFELFHWATHVEHNSVDRILLAVPGVRRIRADQIAHHLKHHKQPMDNYAFTFPYPLDRV